MVEKNIEIIMDDQIANGIFANMAIINHSDAEMTFDFIYLQPNAPKGKVRSRIIMTPSHAKKLSYALKENIKKFEDKHGEIPLQKN